MSRLADAAGIDDRPLADRAHHRQVRMTEQDEIGIDAFNLFSQRFIGRIRDNVVIVEISGRRCVIAA